MLHSGDRGREARHASCEMIELLRKYKHEEQHRLFSTNTSALNTEKTPCAMTAPVGLKKLYPVVQTSNLKQPRLASCKPQRMNLTSRNDSGFLLSPYLSMTLPRIPDNYVGENT